MHFNPRTPCGVRPFSAFLSIFFHVISIHAPIAGCDPICGSSKSMFSKFQSTHPLRGATVIRQRDSILFTISIHAPLAGCDQRRPRSRITINNFNPRTPCGVRLRFDRVLRRAPVFQSTHPLRGATFAGRYVVFRFFISIHAPLAGCDTLVQQGSKFNNNFNPRTPCGVRRWLSVIIGSSLDISIHAPLAGCDRFADAQPRRQ